MKRNVILGAALALMGGLVMGSSLALAHGDVTPQQVNTKGLPALGDKWKESNPYRGNPKAVEIGASGFNQNCARCHGLEAISGGIAPDLRYLAVGQEGDDWFSYRMENGAVRDGRVYMPVFKGVLTQEALWAIRSYLESRHVNE
jgi:cytochrome c-550 PedF